MRRFLLAVIVVYQNHLIFQLVILQISAFISLVFIEYFPSYKSKLIERDEVFNEITIVLIMYTMIFFYRLRTRLNIVILYGLHFLFFGFHTFGSEFRFDDNNNNKLNYFKSQEIHISKEFVKNSTNRFQQNLIKSE
jgi:hypothetical protein